MGKIANKLQILRTKRKHLQVKIDELIASCPHTTYMIGLWQWGPGRMQLARICNECWDMRGDPSPEERAEFEARSFNPKELGLEGSKP